MTDIPWWQTVTGYQIYPRSFQDSNGDGVGDIPGIISRLDHLADLGIGFVWLSPVYASPMADMGYDIADYRDIAPEFGTLADFDRLLAEAKARGIGIVMDLVVNHSSSEHAWFRAACESREAPTHDYYIWREPGRKGRPARRPPGGVRRPGLELSWRAVGRYYLHVFSPEQPDLNWQNPALREEIYAMMAWWLDRGVAGFRMDVIDLIGKDVDAGIFEDGPYLHELPARDARPGARRPRHRHRGRGVVGDARDRAPLLRPATGASSTCCSSSTTSPPAGTPNAASGTRSTSTSWSSSG